MPSWDEGSRPGCLISAVLALVLIAAVVVAFRTATMSVLAENTGHFTLFTHR
jgi:hypothetical protein